MKEITYTCKSEKENHALFLIAEKFGWRGDLPWEMHNFKGNETMVFGRYGEKKVLTHVSTKSDSTLLEFLYFLTGVKEQIKVKLNSEYTAVVEGDEVTVGCQSFPVSKVKELYEKITNEN